MKHTGYTTDIITDVALDWLKNKRDQNKPFLLMYQHKAPHRNWQPAPRYLDKYKDVNDARAGDAVRRLLRPRHAGRATRR